MTLSDRIKSQPMNWKDWVTAVGLTLTLASVLVKGGQMLEQLATVNRQLMELSTQLHALRADQATTQRDITALRGVDALHDEQIRALRREVDQQIKR